MSENKMKVLFFLLRFVYKIIIDLNSVFNVYIGEMKHLKNMCNARPI